jgi:predicted nucleotidyltransferase component of viral defense system
MNEKERIATSISARLKRIADDRRVLYGNILTAFLIERAVARLTRDPLLTRHLVFKGGFVNLRVYRSPRFTVDLDAVLHDLTKERAIVHAQEAMSADLMDGVWFRFERSVELTTQQEYGGTRLVHRAGLGQEMSDIRRAQIVNVDIGVGDPVTPAPRELAVETFLADEPITWRVYTAETTIAEKLHALVTLGSANSRSKDLFDLDHLLPAASTGVLNESIANTFRHRGTLPPASFSRFLSSLDETTLRRGWKSAVQGLRDPPDFDVVVGRIIQSLVNHDL